MYKDMESHAIIKRFFLALDTLKADKRIRGRQTFCTRYGINKRNFYKCINNPSSGVFEPAWLYYICRDYGICPSWIMMGQGGMYASITNA